MLSEQTFAYAREFGKAVAFELEQAQQRAAGRLYTEAVLRLGRATEAALYAVAREFGVNVLLQIPHLVALEDSIRGYERRILKGADACREVHSLWEFAQNVAKASATLAADDQARQGIEVDQPLPTNSILRELVLLVDDPDAKQLLGKASPQLSKLMGLRNVSAHACPKGELRETNAADYPQLETEFDDFLKTLFEVALGEKARRQALGPGSASP